jgi:hypothetical protein
MKIKILFIAPEKGIGGGNRKFKLYYDNLNDNLFEKYWFEYKNNDKELIDIILRNKMNFVYIGKSIDKNLFEYIRKISKILINVNFTDCYINKKNVYNLIISKTDYYKLKLIHKKLKNSFVVYNPIDVDNWLNYQKKCKKKYSFNNKIKFIIGRLGRAEPSKWHFLMINTLLKLDKQKNYDYGFIFAGFPLLYQKFCNLFLSIKMKNNILYLPELKTYNELTKFYNSIDLFWQTSWVGESFGNVIAESFCFKKPVITDFKHFYKNNKINKERYDAQCELVDHGKNGFYSNYPGVFIKTLNKLDKNDLKKLGQNGFEKTVKNYDAKIAGRSLAKICYNILKKEKNIKDIKFEKIKLIPSNEEINSFDKEYEKRMNIAEEYNIIKNKKSYNIKKKSWRLIEYVYLIIRKLLNYIKIDLERIK